MEPQNENAPSNVSVFLSYFIPAIIFISVMLNRVAILRALLGVSIYIFNYIKNWFLQISSHLNNVINSINAQQFVYFTKRDNIAVLNKVMLYIKNNEHTKNLKIDHVATPST